MFSSTLQGTEDRTRGNTPGPLWPGLGTITLASAVVSLPEQVTSLAQTQGGWAGTEFTS